MKINISIFLVAIIAILPAVIVFLTMIVQYKKLENEKRILNNQFLENNSNQLDLEKEIVSLREKINEKSNGVVAFNNKTKIEKAL